MMNSTPKSLVLFVFFLTIHVCSKGQSIWTSAPRTLHSLQHHVDLVRAQKTIIERVKYKNEDLYWLEKIRKYIPAQDSIFSRPLSYVYKGIKGEYLGMKSIKGNPYIFYRHDYPNESVLRVCALALNTETLMFDNPPILLLEQPQDAQERYTLRLEQCENSSIILLHYPQNLSKKASTFGAYCYDTQLQLCLKRQLPIPAKSKFFDLSDIKELVYHQESLYLLLKNYSHKLKKEEKKKGARYFFSLLKVPPKDKPLQTEHLEILSPNDSAIIVSAALSLNKKEGPTCWGTYKQPNGTCGLFCLNININQKQAKTLYFDYPDSINTALRASTKQQSRHQKLGLQQLKITAIIPHKDQKTILVAEQQYTKIYDDKSVGKQHLYWVQHSLVLCVQHAKIQWTQLIPNKQCAGGPAFGKQALQFFSAGQTNQKDDLYIFVNSPNKPLLHSEIDNRPCLELNVPSTRGLSMYKIDKNTGKTRQQVYSLSDSKATAIVPFIACPTIQNSIYFIAVSHPNKPKEAWFYQLLSVDLN
jgi:hypothetical protein